MLMMLKMKLLVSLVVIGGLVSRASAMEGLVSCREQDCSGVGIFAGSECSDLEKAKIDAQAAVAVMSGLNEQERALFLQLIQRAKTNEELAYILRNADQQADANELGIRPVCTQPTLQACQHDDAEIRAAMRTTMRENLENVKQAMKILGKCPKNYPDDFTTGEVLATWAAALEVTGELFSGPLLQEEKDFRDGLQRMISMVTWVVGKPWPTCHLGVKNAMVYLRDVLQKARDVISTWAKAKNNREVYEQQAKPCHEAWAVFEVILRDE